VSSYEIFGRGGDLRLGVTEEYVYGTERIDVDTQVRSSAEKHNNINNAQSCEQ